MTSTTLRLIYPDGHAIENPSEAALEQAIEDLNTTQKQLVIQAKPNEVLLVIRSFRSRYYLMHDRKGKATLQTVHALSLDVVQRTVLSYCRLDQHWNERLRWEKETAENTKHIPNSLPPLEQQSTELLKRRLRSQNKLLTMISVVFAIFMAAFILLFDLNKLTANGFDFGLILSALFLPFWFGMSTWVLLRSRRQIKGELKRRWL